MVSLREAGFCCFLWYVVGARGAAAADRKGWTALHYAGVFAPHSAALHTAPRPWAGTNAQKPSVAPRPIRDIMTSVNGYPI